MRIRCVFQISVGAPSRKSYFWPLFILLPACFLISNCAQSLHPAKVADLHRFLNDRELDSVTAGGVGIDLELSAGAEGTTAVTSTQGSITTARSSVLRIAVDPSAPEPARARLLGVAAVELVFANGKANAAGTSNAQCSAASAAFGDAIYVAQSKTVTGTTATCSCSGFGIGIVAK